MRGMSCTQGVRVRPPSALSRRSWQHVSANLLKIRKPCCEKLRDGPSVACRTLLSKRASSQRLWKLKV